MHRWGKSTALCTSSEDHLRPTNSIQDFLKSATVARELLRCWRLYIATTKDSMAKGVVGNFNMNSQPWRNILTNSNSCSGRQNSCPVLYILLCTAAVRSEMQKHRFNTNPRKYARDRIRLVIRRLRRSRIPVGQEKQAHVDMIRRMSGQPNDKSAGKSCQFVAR